MYLSGYSHYSHDMWRLETEKFYLAQKEGADALDTQENLQLHLLNGY